MPVKKLKPTTPGQRFTVRVVHPHLHKGDPYAPLVVSKKRGSGRNNQGRITVRHKGGGHKRNYRIIDFKRNKDDIVARVEHIEYDPNRSAHIALLVYMDGERRYIVAPRNLKVGDKVQSGVGVPIKVGNTMPLAKIPLGSVIHCVELKPGKGAQLARSAGTSVQLIAREGDYASIRLRSGEIRKVLTDCRATFGEVSNTEHNLRVLGKAGAKRHRGIRPTVRGVAMNPVDHPHGGGEGRRAPGRHPVSPTGVKAKGYKTRNNKRTQKLIVKTRKAKKAR